MKENVEKKEYGKNVWEEYGRGDGKEKKKEKK